MCVVLEWHSAPAASGPSLRERQLSSAKCSLPSFFVRKGIPCLIGLRSPIACRRWCYASHRIYGWPSALTCMAPLLPFQYILLVFRDSSITSCAPGCQPWPWGPCCVSICFCGGFLCRGQLGPCSCGRGSLCPCHCFPAVAMWVRAISFHLHIS